MAKIAQIGSEPPGKNGWLVWAGIIVVLIFLLILSALLLNFLGLIDLSSLPLPLPWFKSPAEESVEIQLEELLRREIADLEADQNQLLSRLDDKEGEIAALKDELHRLQDEIAELTRHLETLTDMISVYSSMEATAAAAILEKLPVEEVLPILGKLKKNQAAAILAELDPDKASEITTAWARIN